MENNQKFNLVIVAVVVVAIVAGAYFIFMKNGKDVLNSDIFPTLSPSLSSSPSPTVSVIESAKPSSSPTASPTTTVSASVKSFTVLGSLFKFSLGEIRVKKGDTVKITFKNTEGMHNWKIDEFNAGTEVLEAGQEETIQFVAYRTGRFEYYC